MTTNKRPKGIYILPNLFTTAALFSGFYAIISAMHGAFNAAAIAIFIAMLCDGLDGRVARMTNTQTAFGVQYDSLSDLVSFGIAPALVIYNWSLHNLGKFGWLIAFIYVVAVALRLARFNTQVAHADKRYFQGLPCPPAAAVIAGMVWAINPAWFSNSNILLYTSLVLTLILSLFMVSNIRYHSFKDFDLRKNVSFLAILIIVLVGVLIAMDPPKILFAAFTIYALSAPLINLWQLRKTKKLARKST
jgi:CDP-diacylglycerol--serine O-phosphatidyltransferase